MKQELRDELEKNRKETFRDRRETKEYQAQTYKSTFLKILRVIVDEGAKEFTAEFSGFSEIHFIVQSRTKTIRWTEALSADQIKTVIDHFYADSIKYRVIRAPQWKKFLLSSHDKLVVTILDDA